MNFPSNPTLNQTYTYNSKTWKWDGTAWNLQVAGVSQATVAFTGSFTDLVNKPTTITGYGITDAYIIPTQTGNSGKYLTTNGTTTSWATVSANPGGSTTQVQFNNASAFGGNANFVWDNTNLRLGIGITAASYPLHINSTTASYNTYLLKSTGTTAPTEYTLYVQGSSGGSNANSYAGIRIVGTNGLGNSASITMGVGDATTYGHHDVAHLALYSSKMIDGGSCLHWTNSGVTTRDGCTSPSFEWYNTRSDNQDAYVFYAAATNYAANALFVGVNRTTVNNTFNLIYARNGNSTGQFIVRDSGNAVNTNNSYGAISDIKLKQDIIDVGSQWNDVKNFRVRKFRFKNEVEQNPEAKSLLGLIAQEAELISPGLIDESKDYGEIDIPSTNEAGETLFDQSGNPIMIKGRVDLGTTTKQVKYSILYMKAFKALQEAMQRIEQLEARVAQLETK